ncbi:MAG: hypothetical protein ACOYN0_12690, partial [Phycisphaerales bacterium]
MKTPTTTKTMFSRTRPALALTLTAFGISLHTAAANAQVQFTTPATSGYGTPGGITLLPGSNASTTGTLVDNIVTSNFRGDLVGSLVLPTVPGTYRATAGASSILPFSIGPLPVRIGEGSLHANFKVVASGGNGVPGGDDPIITVRLLTRLYQQIGDSPVLGFDPWLSSIEFTDTVVQDGSGFTIFDRSYGPGLANYVFTPGNFYIYQQIVVDASYTTTGRMQPPRGFAVEFGGALSNYSGLEYSFEWQTVPAPGALALAGIGGLTVARRKRR